MDLTIFAFSNTDARSLRSLSSESVAVYETGRFRLAISEKDGNAGVSGTCGPYYSWGSGRTSSRRVQFWMHWSRISCWSSNLILNEQRHKV